MHSNPPTFFHLSVYSGVGIESALLFTQDGADVLLVDVNLPAEKALALIQERFPKAAVLKADVGKGANIKAMIDNAVELFDRLDVMVRVYPSLLLLPRLLYPRLVRRAFPPRAWGARARSSALHANPLTRRAFRRGYVLPLSLALPARPVSSSARAQLRAGLPVPRHA